MPKIGSPKILKLIFPSRLIYSLEAKYLAMGSVLDE
jgi:hypothetical protein